MTKYEPEYIEGLGQFKAGQGAIVTDWFPTKDKAELAFFGEHALAILSVAMYSGDLIAAHLYNTASACVGRTTTRQLTENSRETFKQDVGVVAERLDDDALRELHSAI